MVGNPEIPPFLHDKVYIDLSSSYESGIEQIAATINQQPLKKSNEISNVLDTVNFAKEIAKELVGILTVNQEGVRVKDSLRADIDSKLVFVIIAFTSDMEPVFEGIKAAGEHYGLKVERVKDIQGDYRITNKVIQMMHKAFLIVADLTHERPNVYFELG